MSQRRWLPVSRGAAFRRGIGLCCAALLLLFGCREGANRQASHKSIAESDFDRVVLQSKLPVLVDFSTTWCVYCQEMAPVIEELTSELKDRVTVVQVDGDECPGLVQRYNVTGYPCFIVFKNGQPVARQPGKTSKRELKDLIAKNS